MKRIGIIGFCMGRYESIFRYCDAICRQVDVRTKGKMSPDLMIRCLNIGEYLPLIKMGDWRTIGDKIQLEAMGLAYSGCDYIAITPGTMHKIASSMEFNYFVDSDYLLMKPVHIGDCIGEECERLNIKRVLLLGTESIMTEQYMKDYISDKYGIEAVDVRGSSKMISGFDHIIFNELRYNTITPASRDFVLDFCSEFLSSETGHKPEAIVLCDAGLNVLLSRNDITVPLIDASQHHINKIVDLCLKE